jgi:hypothetical protein
MERKETERQASASAALADSTGCRRLMGYRLNACLNVLCILLRAMALLAPLFSGLGPLAIAAALEKADGAARACAGAPCTGTNGLPLPMPLSGWNPCKPPSREISL